MLLKYFYDKALAHASYMVGCQRAKVALVVDPGRDIDQYLETAKREGVKVVAVAETHIHADYVSGARELADRVGAKLYVSDEGPAEWKYQYAGQYDHQLLTDGDSLQIPVLDINISHSFDELLNRPILNREHRVYTIREARQDINFQLNEGGATIKSSSRILIPKNGGHEKHLIFKKGPVLDGSIDSKQVLKNNAAGADIQMPHLRVSHNTLRQTNSLTGAHQPGVEIGGL